MPCFLIILLINWYLNWCHYLAIMNCTIVNMDEQVPLWYVDLESFGYQSCGRSFVSCDLLVQE